MNQIVRGRPFEPGVSGNPDGRIVGTRNKFSEAFYRDLAATWAELGESAMRQTATLEPAKFVAINPRSRRQAARTVQSGSGAPTR
jgi:hypothetical protein